MIKELAGDEIWQGTNMLYYQMILSESSMSVGVFSQGTTEIRCHYKFVKERSEANFFARIFTNGPAIKCVNVAERMEAGG
jgi:hypothetical protein